MPRLKTYFEELFFMNDRRHPQYCETCLGCLKKCKQSFRAEVIWCRRREPMDAPKKRKPKNKAA